MTAKVRSPASERELAERVAVFLATRGYEVWVNPDGSDYFDLVALRGNELGLIEVKLHDWRRALVQAVERRGWADWVAVAVPRRSLAERLLARAQDGVSLRVGIWAVEGEAVHALRLATAARRGSGESPFSEMRNRLQELLDVTRGATALGSSVRWSIQGGGRGMRALRLEEFEGDSIE